MDNSLGQKGNKLIQSGCPVCIPYQVEAASQMLIEQDAGGREARLTWCSLFVVFVRTRCVLRSFLAACMPRHLKSSWSSTGKTKSLIWTSCEMAFTVNVWLFTKCLEALALCISDNRVAQQIFEWVADRGIIIIILIITYFYPASPPLPPLGHIWDVMLVWRKRNIEKTVSVFQYCVLLQWCTKIRAVLTGQSTVSGFDLA